jgi:hypothetical protein
VDARGRNLERGRDPNPVDVVPYFYPAVIGGRSTGSTDIKPAIQG